MNPADLFAHQSDTLNLAPGETLFRQGDAGDAMFVVLEGTLQVLVGDKVVENATRGAIIGEMALIDPAPRNATVVAVAAARLVKVDQRRFHFLIQQNPFFATHVMKELVERLRAMNKILAAAAV
ncbi:MAG: cyclic nucleotide-binding domain-containing protein [Verrucomicrobiae bacterium]|nr:cyclic nucleotide-binding domain-containing protein [Verrucomicrobiae bacterium]